MSFPTRAVWCERWRIFVEWPGKYDCRGLRNCLYSYRSSECKRCRRKPPAVRVSADKSSMNGSGRR